MCFFPGANGDGEKQLKYQTDDIYKPKTYEKRDNSSTQCVTQHSPPDVCKKKSLLKYTYKKEKTIMTKLMNIKHES